MAKKVLLGLLMFLCIIAGQNHVYAETDSHFYKWDHVPRRLEVPILMYHYVDTPPANADTTLLDLVVTRQNFVDQMKWLKDNGYVSITPDQLIAALWHGVALPPKPVMLTFDDGYANAWYNAYPVLKQFGFTGTFFVITNWLDQNKPGYITWDLARSMANDGMVIGSHTGDHLDVRSRTHDWYQKQFVDSAKAIYDHTGIQPRYFCYPFGGYDDVAIRELRAAGYVAAFTENDSRFAYSSNTMRLPRVRIRGAMNVQQFARAVTGDR